AFGRVVVVRGAARFEPPHAASRTTAGTKTPRATTVRDRRAGSVVELMSAGHLRAGRRLGTCPPCRDDDETPLRPGGWRPLTRRRAAGTTPCARHPGCARRGRRARVCPRARPGERRRGAGRPS